MNAPATCQNLLIVARPVPSCSRFERAATQANRRHIDVAALHPAVGLNIAKAPSVSVYSIPACTMFLRVPARGMRRKAGSLAPRSRPALHTWQSVHKRPLRTAPRSVARRRAHEPAGRRTRVPAARHHRRRRVAAPAATAAAAAAVTLLVPGRNAVATLLARLALRWRPTAIALAPTAGAAAAATARAVLVAAPASGSDALSCDTAETKMHQAVWLLRT